MQNLAGHSNATAIITRELERCGIEVVPSDKPIGGPKSLAFGKLGSFEFQRAWYYYVVTGNVPLVVAEELYEHPVGRSDIRVNGNCGCSPPTDHNIRWFADDGREVLDMNQKAKFESFIERHPENADWLDKYIFVDDKSDPGFPYITGYHIDSELGLYIFAETLKKHGLIDR